MEIVRKTHNNLKRTFIQSITNNGSYILDVGCGCGGDLQKWYYSGVHLDACEPCRESLNEAMKRSRKFKFRVNFYHGDIFVCPEKLYDIICYNFSIQYIFYTHDLLIGTIHEIKKRLNKNGVLIGCVPDSEQILLKTPFCDEFGNTMEIDSTKQLLHVNLVNTPYYASGPKSEPIAYKDVLIYYLEQQGIMLELWEPFGYDFEITKLYSKFIFRNIL